MYSTHRIIEQGKLCGITRQDILSRVSDYDIFAHYVGLFKIGKIYNSPLRDDKNPSFGIFVDKKTGDLLYKDLGSGDCGDVFKFVKKLKGLSTYKEALSEIVKELDVNLDLNKKLENRSFRKIDKETAISVVRRPLNSFDLEYWESFGISIDTLKIYNVSSVSKYIVNNIVKGTYKKGNPMYAYKVFNKFKIYRPFESKINKWRGNLSNLDIQGYEQLPEKGDLLIITKSLKDVMALYELGYTAIAPASESILIPELVVNTIKKRFSRIIMIYDRDRTGMLFTRKMVKSYYFDFFFINKKFKTKDISDYIKRYGKESALELLSKNL